MKNPSSSVWRICGGVAPLRADQPDFCIQGWSGLAKWGGVSMSNILGLVRPQPQARWLVFSLCHLIRRAKKWRSLILRSVDPNGRVRSSASRRFAGQMEQLVQGVAQRALELVVEVLDVNTLLARIDLNAVLVRVELNDLLDRVDINQVLDGVDINRVLDRADINRVLDRADMDRLMARIDINEIAARVDIEALVANTDLGALMASSSSTLATEAVDRGRSHAVSMDDTIARWVSRLRRDHAGRADPPELPDAQEEP